METVGRYTLRELLGRCEAGGVWSAVDPAGQRFTVAVLDAAVASQQPWRDAFSAAAHRLAQLRPDPSPLVAADHSAAAPWVVCADGGSAGAERVFVALGLHFQPERGPADPPDTAAQSAVAAPTAAQSAVAAPTAAQSAVAAPTAAQPTIVPRPVPRPARTDAKTTELTTVLPGTPENAGVPTSAGPAGPDRDGPTRYRSTPRIPAPRSASGATGSPVGANPATGIPVGTPTLMIPGPGRPGPPGVVADPGRPGPDPRPTPPPTGRRGRGGVVLVAVAALLLGAAGGVAGTRLTSGDDARPAARPAPTSTVPAEPDIGRPAKPPVEPGLEPPQEGTWPVRWRPFDPTDQTRTMTLDGVGFPFEVPENWECSQSSRTDGYLRYTCGLGSLIGGELVVRHCPQPCDQGRRTELREMEEAWGLRWRSSGPFATWAETNKVNGTSRYALIYIGYWRSVPEESVDRQLVVRLTGPVDQAGELRKVCRSIRDATWTN